MLVENWGFKLNTNIWFSKDNETKDISTAKAKKGYLYRKSFRIAHLNFQQNLNSSRSHFLELFVRLTVSLFLHLTVCSSHACFTCKLILATWVQKSHQGRSSFPLKEDQVQDLISCRLALFQLREKGFDWRGELLRRLRGGCKAKELTHAGISGGGRTVARCLSTVGMLGLPFYTRNARVAFLLGCLLPLSQHWDFLQWKLTVVDTWCIYSTCICWSSDFASLLHQPISPTAIQSTLYTI